MYAAGQLLCLPECMYVCDVQEKLKRMNPEQRAKIKAREERVQMKRQMKQRMIRA